MRNSNMFGINFDDTFKKMREIDTSMIASEISREKEAIYDLINTALNDRLLAERMITLGVAKVLWETHNLSVAQYVYNLARSEDYYLYFEKYGIVDMSRIEALAQAKGEEQLRYAVQFDKDYGKEYVKLTKVIGHARNEKQSYYVYHILDIYAMTLVSDNEFANKVFAIPGFLSIIDRIGSASNEEAAFSLYKSVICTILGNFIVEYCIKTSDEWLTQQVLGRVLENGQVVNFDVIKEIFAGALKRLAAAKKKAREIQDEVSDDKK